MTGATALNGGLTMVSNKFVVTDTTGNTAIAGTLDVTGATALSSTATVTGATALNGRTSRHSRREETSGGNGRPPP